MVLTEDTTHKILEFVKKEPRTVQDLAKYLKKSWLTADSYLQQIQQRTGLISIKTFRQGTQGALKLAYYNHPNSLVMDEVRSGLAAHLQRARFKTDFDFMDIYQFIPKEGKSSFLEPFDEEHVSTRQHLVPLFRTTQRQLLCFSGNISFINMEEDGVRILDILEELLQRRIIIRILTRVNLASVDNLTKLKPLFVRYPQQLEIRHAYQPLRGFLIDGKYGRFKDEEHILHYKKGELARNVRIFYDITDASWTAWLEQLFWTMYRSALDHQQRLEALRHLSLSRTF